MEATNIYKYQPKSTYNKCSWFESKCLSMSKTIISANNKCRINKLLGFGKFSARPTCSHKIRSY